ncbi:MAG: hypothetical protein IIZ83_05110 [Oscillospiraceae bacterium]|nr:hypothetical protein [Oscillospiraceae bacterium]
MQHFKEEEIKTTQEESTKLIRMMTALFPGMRQQNAEDAAAAYWHVLKGYEYKAVRDAVIILAGKQRMYPAPSEIVELLPKQGAPQAPLDHWTRDAVRRLLGCDTQKCDACPDVRTCRLR